MRFDQYDSGFVPMDGKKDEVRVVKCQFCHAMVERRARGLKAATCHDCKMERARKYSRARHVPAVRKPKEPKNKRRMKYVPQNVQQREDQIINMLMEGNKSIREIGLELPYPLKPSGVYEIIRAVEKREGITLPRATKRESKTVKTGSYRRKWHNALSTVSTPKGT